MSEQLIEVVEEVTEEIAATGADVRAIVGGARFVAGEAALQQAVEVRKLIDALAAAGIAEKDVGIESVRVSTSKGALLKSSSATYVLAVRCREPKLVAEAIDAVAAQKNCKLDGVTWRYDVPESIRHEWLARCVRKAKAAADAIAGALGARVSGAHKIIDDTHGKSPQSFAPRGGYGGYDGSTPIRAMKQRVADALDDLELAPKQEQTVRVRAWFAIAS